MDANTTNTEQEVWKPFLGETVTLTPAEKNMIAGGLAGCLGKTLTAPLSRLTVLSQVSSLFPKGHPHHTTPIDAKGSNIFSDLRKIIRTQGVLSLWNGNWTSVLHRFPYSAINFAVFEATNDFLSRTTHEKDATANRFVAGAVSGAAACFVCYPLDLVRTRLTVANSFVPAPEGTAQRGSKIYRLVKDIILKEGVAGLYRGLPVSLFVTAPTLAISFSIYGFIKSKLITIGGIFVTPVKSGEAQLLTQQPAVHLSPVGSLCAGCLSGIASSSAIFPVDVVRKRMQVMGQLLPLNTTTAAVAAEVSGAVPSAEDVIQRTLDRGRAGSSFPAAPLQLPASAGTSAAAAPRPAVCPQSSSLQQARHILRTEGVRGFYRGLVPELLKVCPMVAVMYCSYEIVQDTLNEYFPDPVR